MKELPQPVRFLTDWAITTQELRSVPLVAISPTSGTEWEHMTLNDRSVRNKNLRTFQDLYADLKRRTPGAIERELVAKEIHLLEQMNATPGAASQQPSATAGTLAATGAAHGDEISSQNPDVISPEGAFTQQPTAGNEGIFASALRRGTGARAVEVRQHLEIIDVTDSSNQLVPAPSLAVRARCVGFSPRCNQDAPAGQELTRRAHGGISPRRERRACGPVVGTRRAAPGQILGGF